MNTRKLWLLVPVVALAAGYIVWAPGEGDVDAITPNEPGSAAAMSAPGLAAPPVAVVGGPEPGADIDAPGCELVEHYLPAGDGTLIRVLACEADNAPQRHPYESYSTAALESLAYADAKAAAVLGMRLRDVDEAKAMSLMLRASALAGGDTAPIFQYVNAYPQPTSIDEVPVRKTVHTKFVLSAVADLLSDNTHYASHWEGIIRAYSTDPDTEIAMLQAQARRIVAEMREIQLNVTGSATIGGQGDA